MSLCLKQVSSEVMNSWEDEICTFCRLFSTTYLQMCINLPIFPPPALLWDVSGSLSGIFIVIQECWRAVVFYPGECSQKMGLGTASFIDQPSLLCIAEFSIKCQLSLPSVCIEENLLSLIPRSQTSLLLCVLSPKVMLQLQDPVVPREV